MRTSKKQRAARQREFLYQAIALADAEKTSDGRPYGTLTVTVGDIDLPAFVSDGRLYVQAPLPLIFRAFASDLSDFISDMEIRVSSARGATLPLVSDGGPLDREELAEQGVVRDSGRK